MFRRSLASTAPLSTCSLARTVGPALARSWDLAGRVVVSLCVAASAFGCVHETARETPLAPSRSVAATAGERTAILSRRPRCERHLYGCMWSGSMYLEEDNMQLNWRPTPHTDQNYTMGFGLSRAGASVVEQGHDFALRWADWSVAGLLDRTLFNVPGLRRFYAYHRVLTDTLRPKAYAELLSGSAFTPKALYDSAVIVGDRPYAFLLGWTVRRGTALDDRETAAVTTELTLGTIGSRLGRNVQRAIHAHVRNQPNCDPRDLAHTGPCDPKGWSHQIMDMPSLIAGEPTLRYGLLYERRLAADWLDRHRRVADADRQVRYVDAVLGAGGEAGYYTDAYLSGRVRVGYFSSPFYAWWQNPLSLGSVLQARAATHASREELEALVTRRADPPRVEGYVYGGIRPRVWAYNALLQGYPGYHGYAFPRDSVQTFEADGELGLSALLRFCGHRACSLQGTWEFDAGKSPEFHSPLQSAHYWGGAFVTFAYRYGP